MDEKKIEEAALAKYNDGLYADDAKKAGAFKEGAHWAIEQFFKDLWHPAKEEPNIKEERQLICIFQDKGIDKILPVFVSKTMEWKHFSKVNGVSRWLYIDDLLELKGGKK